MRRTIGVLAAEHVVVGLVEGHKVLGALVRFPERGRGSDVFRSMPADGIGECLRQQIQKVGEGQSVEVIGVGFPGIIRNGIIQESPNLQQVKGLNLETGLAAALRHDDSDVPVRIFNDADVIAAGVAATRGQLGKLTRVWTLGNGIGFGRYPWSEGAWEGGHVVVTLDPKEHFCGCGGKGHLEGIMGHRAMRLRFLDMEPDEIFANAKSGDARCDAFVKLWHRALAAATATSIHMDGPGDFYITGPNAQFVDIGLLHRSVHEMVKMTPLQGSRFEIIPMSDEIGIIGAAVNAEQATFGATQ